MEELYTQDYITPKYKNMNNIAFEIVKIVGLGTMESPELGNHWTGLLYFDKHEAEKKADMLWKEDTTEAERKSGWCTFYYKVEEVRIN